MPRSELLVIPAGHLDTASSVLVIDKAQRLPDTSRIIKGWHDARLPAKFLLLGRAPAMSRNAIE